MNYILEIHYVINHIVHILIEWYCRFYVFWHTIQMILVNSDLQSFGILMEQSFKREPYYSWSKRL